MLASQKPARKISTLVLVALVLTSLLTGGLLGYLASFYSNDQKVSGLQSQLQVVQTRLQALQENISSIQNSFMGALDDAGQNNAELISELENQLSAIQSQINQVQAEVNTNQDSTLTAEINNLKTQLSNIQQQISNVQQTSSSVTYENITYVIGENFSLSQLFEQVKVSVVVVQGLILYSDIFGRTFYSQVQGSGFVYNHNGYVVILTNNHVVGGATNITVTFTDGKEYQASILGSNPNTDFAVLKTAASIDAYTPLEIVTSSTLKVGDPVIVVGTPYGLAGSMSNGIVSALNRTLTSTNGEISNIIQTTAPLNPGNSGGPLMNYKGQVVGIATAIVQDSQGIGFAVPSDTILSELQSISITN